MKKYKYILMLLLISSICIKNVYAEEETVSCEDTILTAKANSFDTKTGIVLNYTNAGTNHSYNYNFYTLTGETRNYVAYCRNAGKCATSECNNQTTDQTFTCKKTVFDPNAKAETPAEISTKAYEKGIVEILKKGYNSNNGSSYQDYIATNIALRTYEMLWVLENTNGSNDTHRLNQVMKYYTNLWLDNESFQSKLDTISTSLEGTFIRKEKYFQTATVNSWVQSSSNITSSIQTEAFELVNAALDASIDYINNGSASITWNEKPEKQKAPVTNNGGSKTYKVTYTYNFDIKNFKSEKATIKMDFVCDDCQKYNVNYKIYINEQPISNLSNTEILNYVEDGTGEVKLAIEFTGNSDTYNCEEINYKLNLKYYDDTISTEAYVMKDADCSTCQWFYVLYADDVEKKAEIEGVAELCTLTCSEAEEQCKEGSQAACEIFNNKYGGDCAECTTYIANAECSESDSEIDLNEGYDVDTSSCGNISEDNLNVVQCIINSDDPAGNSYKATTDEFTKVVDNQFCSVWCKEDYHFTLPGIKEVNSGRYFSLQASIEGQKSCYTSKIDENDTFKDKAESARKAVIDAWNEWNKWYQGLNGDYSDLDNPHVASNKSCNAGHWEDCSWTDENDVYHSCETYVCDDRCDCHQEFEGYKRNWSYEVYSYEGTESDKSYTDFRDGGAAYCFCHSGGGQDGTIANIVSAITGDLNRAEANLRAAIKAYADLINEYDACYGEKTYKYNMTTLDESNTVGWKMEYIYNPTITFWYEESYMNSVLTDELETMGSVSVGGFKEEHFETDNGKIPINNVSEKFKDISSKLESGTNFVCYEAGSVYVCSSKPIKVGTGKYVKQKMDSEGSYITPTQFYTIYPTGAIVVAEAGMEDEIENSDELTNMLPVGLGTRQGVYNYVLKAKDLGEYYNKKNELGRIWGEEDSVLVTVLEEAEEGNSCIKEGALASKVEVDKTTISDGVYVCAYKVNCPDCPVECDPNCKNPNCPDNDCPVECNNCIYTNNETNVNYRPITPSDINPNDRDLGVNWKWDENGISTSLELKAYATTVEIEEDGESIYDINYEDNNYINATDDFAMEITLDSNMISKIRAYNDLYEDYDGYANNTMKCYDYNYNGNTYKNIYCYSTFIDGLLYDNSTKDNIKIVGNRIIGSDEESSDNLRKVQTQDSGYWTTWTDADSSNWTIATTQMIEYSKRYNENIGIGPSWK